MRTDDESREESNLFELFRGAKEEDDSQLENYNPLLQLLRKALDNSNQMELPKDADWMSIIEQAFGQGVHGICLEAIEQLPAGTIPQQALLQWIGFSEKQRQQYEQAWRVACKLDNLWIAAGIQATVLKGRSIAKYYPVPSHRYSCDLDVFIGDEWERACELLEGQGIRLEHEVYKEVEFTLDNVYVECHRYITPVRGNKHLKEFERYLRSLLDGEPKEYFEGTTLVCPPLMFTVMLYIEHALGDLLHGHLTLKLIVDWVVLRRQSVDWDAFKAKCKEFKFDKFQPLIDALADVVEGKMEYQELQPSYQEVFDGIFKTQGAKSPRSWFGRRVELFFSILRNGKKYQQFGYTSMPSFLFNSVRTHFFDKEVKL